MISEGNLLLIPKIREGIVMDHIPSGKGTRVLKMIRACPGMEDVIITLGLNYSSNKIGRKDMLKLAVKDLPEALLHQISVVSPAVSIKRITDYNVEKRYVNEPPEVIRAIARCRNPNCVTNNERHVQTSFTRLQPGSRRFRCDFCERIFLLKELELKDRP